MFKVMILQKRKPGLTHQQFVEHYESKHAPLIVQSQTKMVRFARHYLTSGPYSLDGVVKELEYDVLTELWFEDREAYEASMALMTEPQVKSVIGEDEERFLDRSKSRVVFLEEHESELPGGKRTPDPDTDIRNIILLKRRPDLTLDEFIDYYENHHAPLGAKYSGPGLLRYRRSFLRPAPNPLDGSIAEPAYDVATEVTRPAKGDGTPMSDEVKQIYETDESNFTYKPARRYSNVETRESALPWVEKR